MPAQRAPAPQEGPAPARWSWGALAGRLVELSAGEASAALTLAVALAIEAQRAGEPVAWVAAGEGAFYPPDAAANGLDGAALALVRVAAGAGAGAARAADRLAGSGGFGLVVLELGARARLSEAALARLVQQAQRQRTAVVALTEKPRHAPSLGALVALRVHALRVRQGADRFAVALEALKDKRHGAGWKQTGVYHGAPGLR
ncbi:MAG: recombinase A [Candidatus Lambdaproteobacteria bacterium]|nr:recombinase A [Candidatus Lambdaproteobacteria bacterium]